MTAGIYIIETEIKKLIGRNVIKMMELHVLVNLAEDNKHWLVQGIVYKDGNVFHITKPHWTVLEGLPEVYNELTSEWELIPKIHVHY